jgi:hypothetical protein
LATYFDEEQIPSAPIDRMPLPAKPRWMHWSTYFEKGAGHRTLVAR